MIYCRKLFEEDCLAIEDQDDAFLALIRGFNKGEIAAANLENFIVDREAEESQSEDPDSVFLSVLQFERWGLLSDPRGDLVGINWSARRFAADFPAIDMLTRDDISLMHSLSSGDVDRFLVGLGRGPHCA